MPLVVNAKSYALAVLIVTVAAAATAALIYRRLRYLDLVEVLKTSE
jgi:ABC-type antimicrobial peptide transport system permease subunit